MATTRLERAKNERSRTAAAVADVVAGVPAAPIDDEEIVSKRTYLPLSTVDAGDDFLREIRRATKKPTSWAGLLEVAVLELLKRPDRLEVMVAANRPYRREKAD
jgi:hypothetical protein